MNKITIIGNLAFDPETRMTGTSNVCTFRVAVQRRFTNSAGEKVTDFIPVSAWGKLGELCQSFLAKGRKVAVNGSLQTRNYEDKNGQKRTAFEINADEVEFLSPRGEGSGMPQGNMQQGNTPYSNAPQGSTPQGSMPFGSPSYTPRVPAAPNDDFDVSGFTEMEDSQLPF